MEVVVNYIGKMAFKAICGSHEVMIDLPEASGGEDKAATPPQLFLGSLASCVGVYVASYCQNAGIDATGMQIKITAEKMATPSRLDNIKIKVNLPSADVGKRREAILAVAQKCLIHSTLENHPKVEIELNAK